MEVFGGDHMVFRGGRRGGGFNRCEKSLEGGIKRIHRQSGGGGERGEGYHCDTTELYGRSWIHSRESRIRGKGNYLLVTLSCVSQ